MVGRTMHLILHIEILFIGDDVVVALMLMVYMFPEVRSKPDSNRVIYFTKVYNMCASIKEYK